MRVTFVAPRSWPSVGGAQSFLRHISRALAERHDVRVLALSIGDEQPHRLWESVLPPSGFDSFVDGGVRIEHLRLPPATRAMLSPLIAQVVPGFRRYAYGRIRPLNAAWYARAVARLIAARAAGSDVVHMWGTGLLGAAALRAARLLGAPFVITPFAHRGQWGDDEASARTYRAADRVLALLQADGALYRELGVPDRRLDICGVCTTGVARGGGDALRLRHGIDGPLVLFLGVRRPYKGFDLVLEAAAHVPDATFAFVGPGPQAEGARVVDAGVVDDAERAAWLDAADAVCLPSAAEIFPMSILEAWSVGTPAVTSDIAPLRELVSEGGGVAIRRDGTALAECLRSLLPDTARLRALGEEGRARWRETYSVGAVAARHEEIYRELVSEDARCAA